MREDLIPAWRQLRRTPGFVATATITLALGIGANTAVFSIFNGLVRPLSIPDPDGLVVIAASAPGDETGLRFRFSMRALDDVRAGTTGVFSEVFGHELRLGGLRAHDRTASFIHSGVTANYFASLGLAPAAGRLFDSAEGDRRRSDMPVVLGHAYWKQRFAGDAAIVGTVVALNGRHAEVVGVAPAGFKGLVAGAEMDGYVPVGTGRPHDRAPNQFFEDRSIRPLTLFARLRPGVTIEQAQTAVDEVMRRLSAEHPSSDRGLTARVMPEPMARPLPLPFLMNVLPQVRWILFALSTVVLLIACLNVANLLLVRATAREREMAVRSALGASRHRLIRLQLIESLALAAAGTLGGLLLGRALGAGLLQSIDIGTDVPLSFSATFDWRVFLHATASMLVTGAIVGLIPALRASRASVAALLHDAGRGGTTSAGRERVRSALVVAQVAASVVLLVLAGLASGSLRHLKTIELGFDPSGVATARVDTSHAGYTAAQSSAFYDELERRLVRLPGVTAVSLPFTTPLSYIFGGFVVRPEGAPPVEDAARPSIGANTITPGYFETMRLPLVGGRGFDGRDTATAPRVVIVNETLAERFWPGADPVGRRLVIPVIDERPWRVVGVAANSKYLVPFESPLPHLYLPQAQNPTFLRSVLVRSSGPADEVRRQIVGEIAALAPDLPVGDFRRLEEVVNGSLGFVLFGVAARQAWLLGSLGLLLAVVGLYGLVSFRTAQRTREIGIRMALGAMPADVRRLIVTQGVGLALGGIVLGLACAMLLATAVSRLVLVSPTDPAALLGATLTLVLSALVACYLPARRATNVGPAIALRHE
jgi:predicted permease